MDELRTSEAWTAGDDTALLAVVSAALEAAAPYELPERLQAAVRGLAPAATCVLFLLDHRGTRLIPVGDVLARAHEVGSSEHGRCLLSQQVVASDTSPTARLVPVSVRGDQVGVLEVHDCPASEHVMVCVAGLLGQAVLSVGDVTDRYVVARRWESLTLAAEMQWDKLPGRSLTVPYATIAGHLEPAYQVVGDTYDWTVDGTGLQAVVIDGSGYGTHAAGSTAFTVAALRNARREGADLAGQARLADQAVHARFRGEHAASAVLVDLDTQSRILRYCLAGPGALVLSHGSHTQVVVGGQHPPLGAEEDYPYPAVIVPTVGLTRVVLVSDGALDPDQTTGPSPDWLENLLHSLSDAAAPDVVRRVVEQLTTVHTHQPLSDDAVIVCLDLHLPGAAPVA